MHPRIPLIVLILTMTISLLWADDPAAVVPGTSQNTATRLEEAYKRLAEKKIAEAIALLQNVAETAGNDLIPLKNGRSVCARQLAHAALARLDATGLALYRRKIEPQASKWLREGETSGNLALFRRVVEEAFCSRATLPALTHLGDRAFVCGHFDEAEGWWQLLAPLEPTPLANADSDRLFYPDPPEELAIRTRAKLLLARLFRGQSAWQAEREAFRKRYPHASGTLAGRTGTYARILEETAAAWAKKPAVIDTSWPTFGGSPGRGRVASSPPKVLERLSQLCKAGPTWRFDLQERARQVGTYPRPQRREQVAAARSLAFYPVVVGHQAIVADSRTITAYDLRTGKASEWYDAVAANVGGVATRIALPAPADMRFTLTVAEGCLFARLGCPSIRDVRPDPRRFVRPLGRLQDNNESILVCLDLAPGKDGDRRRWMVRAMDPGRKEFSVFEGAPLVADGRVFIAATHFDGDRVITSILCYPAHPEDSAPALLWRADVCESRELMPAPAGGEADKGLRERNRLHLLTLAGSRIVYCSHSGAVVALDARTGSRAWAFKYPHRDIQDAEDDPTLRDLAPCLFADGRLYVAPSDCDRLYCLDPATGATLWQRESLDAVHLLGVGAGRLIFTTWRNPRLGKLQAGGLRAVGADDGSDADGWSLPDDGGGLAPFGRGLLVGDLVLWPTVRKPYGVFAVRQQDGRQPDNPALLYRIPSGNLVYANGCLLVTDRHTLYAFVPPEMLPDDEARAERELPQPPLQLAREEGIQELDTDADRPVLQSPGSRLALPLRQTCSVKLAPGESFLPMQRVEGPGPEHLWSARKQTLIARSRQKGELAWQKPLPFTPTWLVGLGDAVIACGTGGAAALQMRDGERRWLFLPPSLGRYPASRGNLLPPEPLADFHLAAGHLFLVQGGRRLFALEATTGRVLWQRWAPGAAFAMPPPRGRYQLLCPLGRDALLVQASARRWFLDAATGAVKNEARAPLERWPRRPLVLDDLVCLVPDASTVEMIDPGTGRVRWTYTLPGKTTRSGDPPLVAGAKDVLFVIEPENIGCRLQRLDVRTGKPMWRSPPLLALEALTPSAWLVGPDALYHADAGELTARSPVDGSVRWQRPLPGRGAWKLNLLGETLLAWRDRGDAARFRFRWLTGAIQWRMGPLLDEAPATVELIDAQRGTLVQRINLEEPSLPADAWLEPLPTSVLPSALLWREARSAPGVRVWWDDRGLLAGVGNQVKGLEESR